MWVSLLARRHGIGPNELFRWRRLLGKKTYWMAFIGKVLGISGKTVEARFLQRWQRLRLGRGSGPSSTPQSLMLPAKACCGLCSKAY